MSSPRISFTYQSATAVDPWWLRLVQLGIEDDTATLADAAELIDTLYSIDACTQTTTATEDPDSATTDEVVETEVRRLVCSYDDQANIDVQMHVIRSHPSEPYRLALQGGELKMVETITEITTQTIILEDADSITLDYPVLGDFSASWAGAVYGASGSISPPIRRTGNTLSFGGATIKAGTITATYATEYDLATITILGVDGEPGQCTARGFFHGLVEELELETPEPADELGSCRVLWTVPSDPHQIECYRTVYVSQRCQCSHDELAGYSYEEVVDCPEYIKRCPGVLNECRHYLGTVVAPEYVECPGDMVEAVSVPAYYERICCDAPSGALPQCKELKTSWRGGLGINGGIEQVRTLYGDDVEILPVGPPGGICGTWTKRQQIISNGCCEGVPALAWDSAVSPDVISPNSAVVIGVTGGGKYPYQWTISGKGFQFQNGSRSIETTGNQVRLSALVVACGTAFVTVTDGCSTAHGVIRCTSGKWAGNCLVLKVDTWASTLQDRWRTTSVYGGCAIITTDDDYHNTPSPGVNVAVNSVMYEWVTDRWQAGAVGWPTIDGVAIMLESSLLEALAVVRGNIAVVLNGSLPDTPNGTTSCASIGPCAWVCP